MIRIFIENRELDLPSNLTLDLTYEAIETSKPTATKNAFSKTIQIDGTPNNNDIFGNSFKLDRSIAEGTPRVGFKFDARQRVECSIYDNSDLVDKGYIQLNNIKLNKNKVTYEITFFGELGDFFYSLMYNKDGEELSLKDLYFSFEKEDGTTLSIEEENRLPLLQWDKNYIKKAWDNLTDNGIQDSDKVIDNIIPIPTYSGLYDDFDSNKVLVQNNLITDDEKVLLGNSYGEKPYSLIELPRDLSEWEAMNINARYQRYGIRFKKVLEAICDPRNNDGWTINLPMNKTRSYSKYDDYYNLAYLVMNRFDWDGEKEARGEDAVMLEDNVRLMGNNIEASTNIYDYGKTTLDFSEYVNPSFELSVQSDIRCLNDALGGTTDQYGVVSTPDKLYSSFMYESRKEFIPYGEYDEYYIWHKKWVKTYYCYWISDADGNRVTDVYACSSNFKDGKVDYDDEFKDFLLKTLDIDEEELKLKVVETYKDANNVDVGMTYYTHTPIKLRVKNANGGYKLCSKAVSIVKGVDETIKGWEENVTTEYIKLADYVYLAMDNFKAYVNPRIYLALSADGNFKYEGDISPTLTDTIVTKATLFGTSKTPFEYLIGWARIFGLRFIPSTERKTIDIVKRSDYYQDEVVDLNDRIDRGKEIQVCPTLCENKWLKMVLPTPETYATHLYEKRYNDTYGSYTYDTKYYFNKEENDVYEDTIFTNVIPYRLSSVYFNNAIVRDSFGGYEYKDINQVLNSKTIQLSIFDNDMNKTDIVRYGATAKYDIPRKYDSLPKFCCFDKDNGNVDDASNFFCFFNGIKEYEHNKLYINDNTDEMIEYNENPCYEISDNSVIMNKIPIFSKYYETDTYKISFDFSKPKVSFLDDESLWNDDICTLDLFWKSFITDMYEKDSKKVTLYTFLDGRPQDALRKFYHFDGSLWILIKIEGYDPSVHRPIKCTFTKVNSVDSYTSVEGNGSYRSKKKPIITKTFIEYTTTNGLPLSIAQFMFDATIVSNTYEDGKGIIEFDGEVTSINANAFKNASTIKDMTLPSSVTSIGNDAFNACSGMTSITLSDNITSIGDSAFINCRVLAYMNVPYKLESVGTNAFAMCRMLPKFSGISPVIKGGNRLIVIDDEVKGFASYGVTKMEIPEGVKAIGEGAMRGYLTLAEVILPSTMNKVDANAFYFCSALNKITCYAKTAPTIIGNPFASIAANGVLSVPQGSNYLSWLSQLPNGWMLNYI